MKSQVVALLTAMFGIGLALFSLSEKQAPKMRDEVRPERAILPAQFVAMTKDKTEVAPMECVQLYGVGLVVGLNNTGARCLSTQQMAIDMLRKMEVSTTIARQSLLDKVFKSGSLSTVYVTAELPEFARKGSKLDIVVSVTDDATSLEGGTLVITPLCGADGEVYAVSQGQISLGSFRVPGVNNRTQNHPTVGFIRGGAFVEREARHSVAVPIPSSEVSTLFLGRPQEPRERDPQSEGR